MDQLIHIGKKQPWNKGKLVSQKAPLKLKDMGRYAFGCKSPTEPVNSPCSTSPLTENLGLVTWQSYASATCATEIELPHAPW